MKDGSKTMCNFYWFVTLLYSGIGDTRDMVINRILGDIHPLQYLVKCHRVWEEKYERYKKTMVLTDKPKHEKPKILFWHKIQYMEDEEIEELKHQIGWDKGVG